MPWIEIHTEPWHDFFIKPFPGLRVGGIRVSFPISFTGFVLKEKKKKTQECNKLP